MELQIIINGVADISTLFNLAGFKKNPNFIPALIFNSNERVKDGEC